MGWEKFWLQATSQQQPRRFELNIKKMNCNFFGKLQWPLLSFFVIEVNQKLRLRERHKTRLSLFLDISEQELETVFRYLCRKGKEKLEMRAQFAHQS